MKKYKLIARSNIINPATGMIHDDFGLMALDGYIESAIYQFDDDIGKQFVIEKLTNEIKKERPDFRIDTANLIEITGEENVSHK